MIKSILLATRPKTLSASLIPVWAGCLAVYKLTGTWHPAMALWTFLSCLFIQIACNFFNDAVDGRNNKDTEERTGPTRATASGQLSYRTVFSMGVVALLIACAFAIPLIELRGWPMVVIGVPCLFFAYGYTGGPYPLSYNGLGEIFVILFFGLVAVLGTIFVQIGADPLVLGTHTESLAVYQAGIVLGIQTGVLCAVMISVNNIRDRQEDAKTGKKTLAVRLGDARARGMTLGFIMAAYITLPLASRALHIPIGQCWWYWLPCIVLAGYIILLLNKTPEGPGMNKLLALSSVHLVAYLATYTLLPGLF